MNNYEVCFFWHTDCRGDWTGEAPNEIGAIVLAMNAQKIKEWCTSEGFHIRVRRVI